MANKAPLFPLASLLVSLLVFGCDVSSNNEASDDTDTTTNSSQDSNNSGCQNYDPFTKSDCDNYATGDGCVVYVDGDGEKNGDGTSWNNAVTTVQEGIDRAYCASLETSHCNSWQVWVAQGIYYIHKKCPQDTVYLRAGIGVYGGFSGSEKSLVEKDSTAHETILDGRNGPTDPELAERVFHVVTGAENTHLESLIIQYGLAPGFGSDLDVSGGGVLIHACTVSISDCVLRHNEATWGGAISNIDGTLTLSDSTLSNNVAHYAGALDMESSQNQVSNCLFIDNAAHRVGGCSYLNNARISIVGSEFKGNMANDNAGCLYLFSDNLNTISDSLFEGNIAAGRDANGGGINAGNGELELLRVEFRGNKAVYAGGALTAASVQTTIEDCSFSQNEALTAGGAAILWNGELSVTQSRFIGNTSALIGGAVTLAGPITVIDTSLFAGNRATHGGALYAEGGPLSLVNVTITNNEALASGGIFTADPETSITNSILWNNTPFSLDYFLIDQRPQVTFSVVQEGFLGAGNLDQDPKFNDPESGDFTLAEGSPCIDAGNGEAAPEVDIDGHPRNDDPKTDNPNGATSPFPDIGAFEYAPSN